VPATNHRGQVTVVGSLNIDRIVTLGRFPQPGETIAASTSTTAFGGKGANQAAAAAALRVPTRLIGAVGNDVDGARMIASLQESGVDCGGVQRLHADSGSAFVQVDSSGENQIIIAAGANGQLSPNHVKQCLASLASVDCSEASVLLVSLEIPDEAVGAAIEAGGRPRERPTPKTSRTDCKPCWRPCRVPTDSPREPTGLRRTRSPPPAAIGRYRGSTYVG
jgi:ribokinase